MEKETRRVTAFACLILILAVAVPAASHPSNSLIGRLANAYSQHTKPPLTVTLIVDATEAPRKILHARLIVPAVPGPLTLVYPAWIPGEHAPTGPIVNLTGLRLTAAGKAIPWRRDLVDMFAFHCDVPQGANSVEVSLDFPLSSNPSGFSAAASATAQLVVLSWNQVLLYPKGYTTDELMFIASVRLPKGWKYGTALRAARESTDSIEFQPESLTNLVDSPLIAGAYFRTIPLATTSPVNQFDIVADSAAALDISPTVTNNLRQLVAEAGALFGAYHYLHYDFLFTLSDHVAHFGLEHHQSDDSRVSERTLIDDDLRKVQIGVLPHEFVHSWNAKYRRPADLATPDYQQPMKDDLLWVYEGLTQYLGNVLGARSGLNSADEYRESLAMTAAALDNRPGRTWRSLADTAIAAQLLYGAPQEWDSLRRGVDFYDEGNLIWLEADVIIREQTQGKRSLDDFCRGFHGGQNTGPMVKTYTFDDVVTAMNAVSAYDWRSFFTTRLNSTAARAPLGGIERSGWRLVYTDAMSGMLKATETTTKVTDVSFSIGLKLAADGAILDAIPGMKAAGAGVSPGMKLIAVNGRRWSPEILREALKAAKTSSDPIELLVENADFIKTYRLDYHDGERYPHLERDASKPDLLGRIISPLTGASR